MSDHSGLSVEDSGTSPDPNGFKDGWIRRFWNWLSKRFRYSVTHLSGIHHLYLITIGAFLGVVGGLGAVLFRKLIHGVKYLAYGTEETLGAIFFLGQVPFWRLWLAPVAGAVLVGPIVWYYVKEARGEGVPELLESMAIRNGESRWQVLPAKMFVSSISIGTIASIGREGPIVQIGSTAGSVINQIFNVPRKYWKLVVSCGGAAGLAATFNTPIAGAFFMLEVVLGSFDLEDFAPIVIASVTGTAVGRAFFGEKPAFDLPEAISISHLAQLPTFVILGIAGGLLALLFIFSLSRIRNTIENISIPGFIKTILGALVLVSMSIYLMPNVAGLGYETIEHLIGAKSSLHATGFIKDHLSFIIGLIVLKILAVAISLGAGYSGGVFSPSLFLGAALGYLVGIGIKRIFPEFMSSPVELYAIVGMGAVFSGAAKAPITSILMIFELTRDYKMILPLIISCVIADLVTRFLIGDSIYTIKPSLQEIDLDQSKEKLIMHQLRAKDIMRTGEEPVLTTDTTFEEIVETFLKHRLVHLFVVDDEGCLCGLISLHQIKSSMADTDTMGKLVRAVDLMDSDYPVVYLENRLTDVMGKFGYTDLEELPVVNNEEEMKFMGVVHERDVIGVYNREVLKDTETLAKIVHEEHGEEVTDYFELPEGFTVDQVPVKEEWVGRDVEEIFNKQKDSINVIEIKRLTKSGDYDRIGEVSGETLKQGDLMIVLGPKKNIRGLEKKSEN